MKDTSELTDGHEQATRPSTIKQRPPARSKPDSNTPGSQEQETRPAPRRRNPSSPHAPNTQAAPRNGNEDHTTTTPTTTSRPVQQGQGTAQTPGQQRPMGGGHTNTQQGQRTAQTPGQQRPMGGGHTNTQQGQRYQNSGSAPRQGGYRPQNGGPASRPAGSAPQGQRHPQSSQRVNTAPPGQRQSNAPYQQRSNQHGQRDISSQQRPGGRPGNGHTSSGAPTAQRPSAPRSNPSAQRAKERRAAAVKEKPTGPIEIPPQIVVKDLADLLQTTPNDVIRNLIKHSIFANINQVIDYDKAALVAQDLGFEPSQKTITAAPAVQHQISAATATAAASQENGNEIVPPVITIMGHVDHGKTSLLDTIRKTKVAAGEAGGITQHIGAYQVEVNGKKITFLDTPGHEAFTAMRARGAQVAHIAIIVVAADDGVMPQTREAIDHARAAGMPIIIALNKIDKENANSDRVKQQLYENGIIIEEYGGEVVCVPISARKGIGIDELLDYILLVAEVQDIRANPNRLATGVIIEAKLEKNIGPQATVLVQQGTLKMGDNIVVGAISGKVRAMFNDRGKRIQKAPPSTPVSIIGLSEVPQAGDRLEVTADEKTARQIAQQEAEKRRDETAPLGQVSLDTLYMQMQQGKVKELNVILKADVQGSSEAIKNSLAKVGEEDLKVRLIREGIGNISETDVHLAAASGAIIIGFNVRADDAAQREAQREGVDIRYYNIIYKLIEDIQAALAGMLEPTYREVVEGHAEILQIFKAGRSQIAGSRVTDGKITRSSGIRVMRANKKVFEGKVGSLRRGKDDVREVLTGYECGIVLEDFNDYEVGDIIEAFTQERVKPGA